MKKKYIAAIVIPSVCLLFGSLIYCAISAFPELLLSEEEKLARLKEAQEEEHYLIDVSDYRDDAYLFEDDNDDNVTISVGFTNVSNPVEIAPESYDEMEIIMVDAIETPTVEIEINDEPAQYAPVLEVETLEVNEVAISNEVALDIVEENEYSNDEAIVEEVFDVIEESFEEEIEIAEVTHHIKSGLTAVEPVLINENEEKEEADILIEHKEMMVNEQGVTSYNKDLESTLIVIGIVDLLSFLLIRKRKKLSHF